ncbi:MAG: MFS transporter, partial [Deltaproteobacteria bacterium]|nr:MFS transporter [Deltaproteobacteria bacterium]
MQKTKSFRTVLKLLFLEGALANAYVTWIGPTYLSGLAGELGASIHVVTLMISLPWVGSIGQILGIYLFEKNISVKKSTLFFAVFSRSIWLVILLLALGLGVRSLRWGIYFPAAIFSSLFGSLGDVTWLTWVRGLVRSGFQGRFWGVRQTYVMATLIGANLIAAAVVPWKPNGFYFGYAMIGILAVLCAFLSLFLLLQIPDIKIKKHPELLVPSSSVFDSIKEILKQKNYRNLLIFFALFNGMIQMVGPYFPYYFTKELKISMSQVAFWAMLANAGYFFTAGYWGKKIDQTGSPLSVLF